MNVEKNFGVIIAFLLPGALFLFGLSYSSDTVSAFLHQYSAKDGPQIGGFLYVTLASLAVGLLLSAVRWLILDWSVGLTLKDKPDFDFNKFSNKDVYAAFIAIVENHYRFYQYYSNSLIALLLVMIAYCYKHGFSVKAVTASAILGVALLLGSRDALGKYYKRGKQVLS